MTSIVTHAQSERPSWERPVLATPTRLIHPASRGVAAHTAGFLRSVTGARQFTYITVVFFTFVHVICISISKSFAAIRSPGRPWPRFPSPPAREFQIATTTMPRKTVQTTFCTVICIFFTKSSKSVQIPYFLKCVCMFLQCFPSKHGNLHICRHKTVPKHHFLHCFQFPCLPKPLKTPLFTLCSSIFPCSNAAGQLKHIYKKSFRRNIFYSVFTFFSVKHTVIYMFLGIKSVQNTGFRSVFNALASKNLSIPLSPQTLENTAIYTVFFNLSMFQCRWPTQTYRQKFLQKHCFLQCVYNVFRQKHCNLHVFRHKVGPKHWFLQCFQCSPKNRWTILQTPPNSCETVFAPPPG